MGPGPRAPRRAGPRRSAAEPCTPVRPGRDPRVNVLVVDDEIKNAELVAAELRDAGFTTSHAGGGAAALQRLEAGGIDALVTDLRMKPPDGMAVLAEVRRRWPETTVVMMTAYGTLETAREALKRGAQDYVEKEGYYVDVIARVLREAAEKRALARSNQSLSAAVESLRRETLPIVGDAPATRAALDLARKVAVTDSTVLLRGERG